jgi:DNA-binding NtrC family response regulator
MALRAVAIALKVLIIDDDDDFARSLAEYFALDGHETDVELTGEAGIQAARVKTYDQIMIDVVLPDMNGVEAMQAIQELTPGAHIVLMTGYSAGHLDAADVNTGSVEVLTKPMDLDEVSKQLATIAAARAE